jgi:hypothetical protein
MRSCLSVSGIDMAKQRQGKGCLQCLINQKGWRMISRYFSYLLPFAAQRCRGFTCACLTTEGKGRQGTGTGKQGHRESGKGVEDKGTARRG